ncbi:MAG: hypothetical protein JEZ10_09505 [Verrucomicrobia bacterium]|nr:hypothetical protein [Verrucomicrobiota bacterium]
MKIHIMQLWNCSRRQRNRPLICFALTTVLFCGSVSAEMRVWEDTSGNPVTAEFVREIFGAVELRRPNGALHSIPLESLSAQDTEYLRTRIAPEIELNVRTQKRGKVRNEEFVRNGDVIDVITAEVQIRKKSRTPFNGILRAEFYLIGKEVATEDYRLSGRETCRIQFTEENKGLFTFQTSADFRVYEEYNDFEVRGAEYAGYLVLVMDSTGNRLSSLTNLSWLKDEKIDALRKLHLDSFFDENCRKRSVPRPSYYDSRIEF